MPPGTQEWSVLPHDPIVELASNLWWVEGVLNRSNRRAMTLARLVDGRIVVHNAIALDEPSMARIDAWGKVAVILVPNALHRRDALMWHLRYPDAAIFAPRGALAAAQRAVPVDGPYEHAPLDEAVWLHTLAGIRDREGALMVRSDDGLTAVFCDTLLNLPKLGGLMGFLLHPTGTLAVPRPTSWWFAKDRAALRGDLLAIAGADRLVRVIPGHGAVVDRDAAMMLRAAAERL